MEVYNGHSSIAVRQLCTTSKQDGVERRKTIIITVGRESNEDKYSVTAFQSVYGMHEEVM